MITVDDSVLSDQELRTFAVVWLLLSKECSGGSRVFLEQLGGRCRLEFKRRLAVVGDLERAYLVAELDEELGDSAGALVEPGDDPIADALRQLRGGIEDDQRGEDL